MKLVDRLYIYTTHFDWTTSIFVETKWRVGHASINKRHTHNTDNRHAAPACLVYVITIWTNFS